MSWISRLRQTAIERRTTTVAEKKESKALVSIYKVSLENLASESESSSCTWSETKVCDAAARRCRHRVSFNCAFVYRVLFFEKRLHLDCCLLYTFIYSLYATTCVLPLAISSFFSPRFRCCRRIDSNRSSHTDCISFFFIWSFNFKPINICITRQHRRKKCRCCVFVYALLEMPVSDIGCIQTR